MLGIADVEKILKDKLKDTPVKVDVKYTSHIVRDDTFNIEFWFYIFSREKKWWEKFGYREFIPENQATKKRVSELFDTMITKYEETMVDLNIDFYKPRVD